MKKLMGYVVGMLAIFSVAQAQSAPPKPAPVLPVQTEETAPKYQCNALTKSGKRCSRKVKQAGLCKQHANMLAAGKEVKTVQ